MNRREESKISSNEKKFVEQLQGLDQPNLERIYILTILSAFAPGFGEELQATIPSGHGMSAEMVVCAVDSLIDKWLHEKGYVNILGDQLRGVGVLV